MALAMKVISQVEAQRKILEEAVSTALELASGKSDGAEVAVSKTTGISVSTRYGEVENVEFNSDGALGITVYHQNRKGSASSTDLSPQAIARTVQAALDIARYTSPDPCAGVADKELLAFEAPDLDLFHPAEVSPDEAIELAARAEQAALQADRAPAVTPLMAAAAAIFRKPLREILFIGMLSFSFLFLSCSRVKTTLLNL